MFSVDLLVVDKLSDQIILGTDFINTYHVILDYTTGTVTLDNLLTVPLASSDSKQRVLRLSQSVCIPACAESLVPVIVHKRFIGKLLLAIIILA